MYIQRTVHMSNYKYYILYMQLATCITGISGNVAYSLQEDESFSVFPVMGQSMLLVRMSLSTHSLVTTSPMHMVRFCILYICMHVHIINKHSTVYPKVLAAQ